jgi:NAD+ synthase (glutamine-hydrolysing)
VKITLSQINPTIGDLTGNAERILAAAIVAKNEGSELLLTPELSICGYPPRDLLLFPDFVDRANAAIAELAKQLPKDITVLVGTIAKNNLALTIGEKPLHNSIAVLKDGEICEIFHKRLLPTYDVFDENRYFQSGDSANVLELNGWKIGVTICEDLWNDEEFWGKPSYLVNPVAELAALGVDAIVNLSASPYTIAKQNIREKMASHTASRYDKPILYVNQIGANDDLIFDGGSFACNKKGEIVARASQFIVDTISIELDSDRRDLITGKISPLLETTTEEIWQALVLGIRDYARKCKFDRAILGLSGGIDSALVAALAVEALGRDRVLGVLMPSPYSSEGSIVDAVALAKNLQMETQTIPIGELMAGFDRTLEPLFQNTEFGIAEENIQSRIRGNLLMAIANKFGYLLLSTGNKSEMAVGYCTLYGDMNGGLAVIADVPKTQVFALCRWLNRRDELIPTNIITKPPSAELKPGQQDSDSLPDYDILDGILEELICHHRSSAEIVAMGYDAATVARIARLVKIAEFKRRQAPPGLKITDRAFGTGWRMPIASNNTY